MGLLSIFQRKDRPANPRGATSPSEAADAVRQARERARRRLMGAVVLLGIAIIGFPLLFETQPRPIPVDIPIEIPRKDTAAPLAVPPARASASQPAAKLGSDRPVITETAADAGREVAAPRAAPVDEGKPIAAGSAAKAPAEPARVAAVPEAKPPAPSPAKPEPAADTPNAAASKGRVVIQVGAFSEANAVRDARARVEKLGLKTYTQVIDTEGGKRTRVRVGPFATRDEAEKAAAQIRSAGLQAALLTL